MLAAAPALTPALPPLLDLAGIAVFALSGALLAARLRQTFVTMAFFALVTGVGMLGAVVHSFARDIEHIWSLVTHLLMFVTPVFYGLDSLSAPARFVIYWLNPLTPFLVALRGLFIGPPAHAGVYLHAVAIGTVVLLAGYAAFLAAEGAAVERT